MNRGIVLAVVGALVTTPAAARADPTFGIAFSIADETVDDAWVDAQVADANRFFAPLGTTFRWTVKKPLAAAHAEMHSRADRDALEALVERSVIDVFVVRALEDVDEPGRMRNGVCWTPKDQRRFIVLSKIARPTVLAHELGHFFGNHQHATVVNNLMSYSRDGGTVFLDDPQIATIQRTSAALLRSGRLLDVGPPWRFP